MSILAVPALGLMLLVSALALAPALDLPTGVPAGAPVHYVADGPDPPPPPEPMCHPCDPIPGDGEPNTASARSLRLLPGPLMIRGAVRRA
jgi:hypothetical protein